MLFFIAHYIITQGAFRCIKTGFIKKSEIYGGFPNASQFDLAKNNAVKYIGSYLPYEGQQNHILLPTNQRGSTCKVQSGNLMMSSYDNPGSLLHVHRCSLHAQSTLMKIRRHQEQGR